MTKLRLLLVLTAVTMGVPMAGAGPASAATCGIDAHLSVTRTATGWNVGGGSNAFCSAPPPAFNLTTVRVAPSNLLYGLLLSGSSRTFSNGCSNGACSITPVFYGYFVPTNAVVTLLNGNAPMCFTASTSATYGGSRSVTACG